MLVGTFTFSGEKKNSKNPKCRKTYIACAYGGFQKEAFFQEKKTSIRPTPAVLFLKTDVFQNLLLSIRAPRSYRSADSAQFSGRGRNQRGKPTRFPSQPPPAQVSRRAQKKEKNTFSQPPILGSFISANTFFSPFLGQKKPELP